MHLLSEFMYLKDLYLFQFRNYSSLKVAFSQGVNCFAGKNGSGKTNLLEAIHFLSMTKGFRSGGDLAVIEKNEEYYQIKGHYAIENEIKEVQCNFQRNQGKKIIYNKNVVSKRKDHIGKIPLLSILPEDIDIINGGPAERRSFMDAFLSQHSHQYLEDLITYNSLLKHRKALLETFNKKNTFNPTQLEVYNEQLIQKGIQIRAARELFIAEFNPIFEQLYSEIVDRVETPAVNYISTIEQNTPLEWQTRFKEHYQKDRIMATTQVGTHKDDLLFTIDELPARQHGSQGQRKSLVIAMKLAQYTLLRQWTQQNPILLLDDIFDKLDDYRLNNIANWLSEKLNGQVFVTDTNIERLKTAFKMRNSENNRFFVVSENQLVEV